jgi:hypothetical protein
MLNRSPHRSDSYIPEDVEPCEDVMKMPDYQVDEMIALSVKEMELAVRQLNLKGPKKVFLMPFTGLMPNGFGETLDGSAYEVLVKRYLEQDADAYDPILSRHVAGVIVGERRVSRATMMDVFRLNGMYVAPSVDVDYLQRHMLNEVKQKVDELNIDEIRVLISPKEMTAKQQKEWFWAEGFVEAGFNKKEDSDILAWDPLVSKSRTRDRYPKAG